MRSLVFGAWEGMFLGFLGGSVGGLVGCLKAVVICWVPENVVKFVFDKLCNLSLISV